MSTATPLQPLSPNAMAAAQEQQGFLARLALLPLSRKLMLAAGIVALIGISLAMTSWSRDASYKVLFAGLSDKDGGAILAQLSQMNVPYKHAEGGSAILVPADKVHDVRLKLAQIGLPKGSTVGFELMDNARFGTTQF
jgi:flagellar M-ring protein FliF